jgi:hypothetical protein
MWRYAPSWSSDMNENSMVWMVVEYTCQHSTAHHVSCRHAPRVQRLSLSGESVQQRRRRPQRRGPPVP